MVKMSISAAFSETFAFIRNNWTQMLAWTGGAVIVLGLLGYLMLGSTITMMAMSAGDPSAMMGAFGRIFLFAILAAVVLYAVCMLIWRNGLYPGEAPNFGWALQAGPAFAFGMFVVAIAAYIVIGIVMFVLALVFGAAFAGAGSFEAFQSGAVGGGAIALLILFYIAILVLFVWLFGRLSVAGPVMADRLTRNPFTGISESWRITGPSQWTIVGFYILIVILSLVYGFVAGLIFGGIMGAAVGGSPTGAIISMIIMMFVVYVPQLLLSFAMPMGIYRAIAPGTSGDVFA